MQPCQWEPCSNNYSLTDALIIIINLNPAWKLGLVASRTEGWFLISGFTNIRNVRIKVPIPIYFPTISLYPNIAKKNSREM